MKHIIKLGNKAYKREEVGYHDKYDIYFLIETGEWLERIGFCPDKENCQFCSAYIKDGSPKSFNDC